MLPRTDATYDHGTYQEIHLVDAIIEHEAVKDGNGGAGAVAEQCHIDHITIYHSGERFEFQPYSVCMSCHIRASGPTTQYASIQHQFWRHMGYVICIRL